VKRSERERSVCAVLDAIETGDALEVDERVRSDEVLLQLAEQVLAAREQLDAVARLGVARGGQGLERRFERRRLNQFERLHVVCAPVP
jgi:hypothetical protein